MGRHYCDMCGYMMCGYSEATECGHYECLCEGCVAKVCEATACEYCQDGAMNRSCDQCDMVAKEDGAWLDCPAPNCPLQERLQDNCCESCWDSFLEEFGHVAGVVNITSATTGDFIKQLKVFDTDRLRTVWQEMAKHFSLALTSLSFMNLHHCILSENDTVSSIDSKKQCAQPVMPPSVSQPQKLLMIEWLPGQAFNRQTGEHGYNTLACGHTSCALAYKEDGCQECKKEAAKAERKRLAKEKAKQAQIESKNVLSDLDVLLRAKFRSDRVKSFVSHLAAKAKANARKRKTNEGLKPVKKQKTPDAQVSGLQADASASSACHSARPPATAQAASSVPKVADSMAT